MEAGKTVVHSGLPVFDHFVYSSHRCRDRRIENPWGWDQIAGTYLLLNEPSIGYVWIIRVF